MSIIFLVGMPFAGKTYWGRVVAQSYHWEFIDLDEQVEAQFHKTIAGIFTEEGEEGFRKKEQMVLQQIIETKSQHTIVACGGGTPAFFNNMLQMKAAGCVVYIKAGIDLLVSRSKGDNSRPLLTAANDLEQKMTALLQQRTAFYEQADYIIDAQNISVLTFEQIIKKCTDRQ